MSNKNSWLPWLPPTYTQHSYNSQVSTSYTPSQIFQPSCTKLAMKSQGSQSIKQYGCRRCLRRFPSRGRLAYHKLADYCPLPRLELQLESQNENPSEAQNAQTQPAQNMRQLSMASENSAEARSAFQEVECTRAKTPQVRTSGGDKTAAQSSRPIRLLSSKPTAALVAEPPFQEDKASGKWVCNKCNKMFATRAIVRGHVRYSVSCRSSVRFACEKCGFSTNKQFVLKLHNGSPRACDLQQKQGGREPTATVKCPYCPYYAATERGMRLHQSKATNCKKIRQKAELKQQLGLTDGGKSWHLPKGLLKCPRCGLESRNQGCIRQHLASKVACARRLRENKAQALKGAKSAGRNCRQRKQKKVYPLPLLGCDHCSLTFRDWAKERLWRHYCAVNSIPYQETNKQSNSPADCDECGLGIGFPAGVRRSFWTHWLRSHASSRIRRLASYRCALCGPESPLFVQSTSYRKHMMRRHGNKAEARLRYNRDSLLAYACDSCGSVQAGAYAFRVHWLQKHGGRKIGNPIVCDVCLHSVRQRTCFVPHIIRWKGPKESLATVK